MAEKIAYLTIDDAPSRFMEEKIEFLDRKDVPAIFFCEGRFIEKRPEMVIKAIEKGFLIGNHAYSHPKFSEISFQEGKDEIKKTDELIQQMYEKADKDRPAKIFRFPHGNDGGENASNFQRFLDKLGYGKPEFEDINYDWYKENEFRSRIDWFWTFDCKEYELEDLETIIARMEEDKPGEMLGLNHPESSDIILIHDHEETREMFEPIINRLLGKGIEFKRPQV